MRSVELEYAEGAAAILEAHGSIALPYLTAEFQPFSSQFRPDLIFEPTVGRNKGKVFVAELRFSPRGLAAMPSLLSVVEHREFVAETLGRHVVYALAVGNAVGTEDRIRFAESDISILDRMTSGEALAAGVLDWARTWRGGGRAGLVLIPDDS